MLVWLSFTLAAACSIATQNPATKSPPSADIVEIDGAKNPELLPEHVVWSSGFYTLALMKEKKIRFGEKFLTTLTLSDPDAKLVYAEIDRFTARAGRCHERGKAVFNEQKAAGRKMPEIEAAMKANTIQCRLAMLEAKDRLLASISPDGRITLTNWMYAERSKIKSTVSKSDLDFYRQPR